MEKKLLKTILKDIEMSENGKCVYPLMKESSIDLKILNSYGLNFRYINKLHQGLYSKYEITCIEIYKIEV